MTPDLLCLGGSLHGSYTALKGNCFSVRVAPVTPVGLSAAPEAVRTSGMARYCLSIEWYWLSEFCFRNQEGKDKLSYVYADKHYSDMEILRMIHELKISIE